jgi:hypothetical protein
LDEKLDQESKLRKLAKKDILDPGTMPLYDTNFRQVLYVQDISDSMFSAIDFEICEVNLRTSRVCASLFDLETNSMFFVNIDDKTKFNELFEKLFNGILLKENIVYDKVNEYIVKSGKEISDYDFILPVKQSLDLIYISDKDKEYLKNFEKTGKADVSLKSEAKNEGFSCYEIIGLCAFLKK